MTVSSEYHRMEGYLTCKNEMDLKSTHLEMELFKHRRSKKIN